MTYILIVKYILFRYNLAQNKVEDSSGCESGIRAGMSSQEPSCSESETNVTRTIETHRYKALDEQSVTTEASVDPESVAATAGNTSCLIEAQTFASETTTAMPNESASTTTATSVTSIPSPLSMTTTLHTHSTDTITTADSAVADMVTTDNTSVNAFSEITDNTTNAYLSAEYLQRIVDKQLEELYSDSTKDPNNSIRGTVASTPLYETDEDGTPPIYQDIGSVATGSSYQQYLTEHLCVPRYSAMPRTASMEVHPSSCNISESEGESLVDSLDDPISPRPTVHHDNRLVRGCVMELLPDNSVPEHKVDRGEAFFIPIREENAKVKENVAEMLPEKLRERLARREKKRMLRKEHTMRKKQKRMQRNYEQQQFRDKDRYNESLNTKPTDVRKSKVQIKTPAPLNVKRKRASARDEILKLESYRIDGRGEMRIDTPREHRIKKNECSTNRVSKTKKNENNDSMKDLIPYNSNDNRNQIQSGSSSETGADTGPRRVYQKTEIQDGEKTIEILEIVECIESSPEVVPICMYRSNYKNSSKIPIPVYRSGTNVYAQQKCLSSPFINRSSSNRCNTPNANSNLDKLIAKILIDALNNKSDEVHFLKSVQKSPKDRKSIDTVSSSKGTHLGFKRSTLPQIRRSANHKFLQKFEVIPEERGSISMESSAEETASNAMNSPRTNSYISKNNQLENNHNQDNLNTNNQNIKSAAVALKKQDVILNESEKMIKEVTKTYQDQSTQIYNEKDIDVKPDIGKDDKARDLTMKTNLETKDNSLHNQNNKSEIKSQLVLKVPAETQTDNNFYNMDSSAKEHVYDSNKINTCTNNKYVQTINMLSASSQTSPMVTPKVASEPESQNIIINTAQTDIKQTDVLKNQTDTQQTDVSKNQTDTKQTNVSKNQTDTKQTDVSKNQSDVKHTDASNASTKAESVISQKEKQQQEKVEQKFSQPKDTIIPKGKRTKSNLSIISTVNTTTSEKTQFKDKTNPKITVKRVSVIKSTASKENLNDTDKQNANVKRTTIRKTKNNHSVSQEAPEEQTVSFKTRTKHVNEVRTRLKPESLCDCLGCCMSSDDGDCAKSQAGMSCSCCARLSRRSADECTFYEGAGQYTVKFVIVICTSNYDIIAATLWSEFAQF